MKAENCTIVWVQTQIFRKKLASFHGMGRYYAKFCEREVPMILSTCGLYQLFVDDMPNMK